MTTDELLRVHVDGLDTAGPYSTVRVGLGRTDNGARVVFIGDTQTMADIASALRDGRPLVATVPTWALIVTANPEGDAA